MNVGVFKVTLRLPENQSLKGKRRVVASLRSRIRGKFNVSIAEVEDNESWQVATLGITCVSNSARHTDEVISEVVAFISRSRDDISIVAEDRETITGF